MTKRLLTDEQREAVAERLRQDNMHTADEKHGIAIPRDTIYVRYGKRAIDIVISSAAIIATIPINTLLAIVTYLDVGKPILFRQQRAGKDGVPFTVVKFRNMTNATDEDGNLLPPEQRVTKWGKFVRRTSLDELLNFVNVLKGDMSIIGPRPLLLEYTDRYCSYHSARLAVRPGLECPPNPRLEDASGWEAHFQNDAWYAENVSLMVDIKKFVRLVEAVFNRKASAVRGGAGRSFFMGYGPDGLAVGLGQMQDSDIEAALGESHA